MAVLVADPRQELAVAAVAAMIAELVVLAVAVADVGQELELVADRGGGGGPDVVDLMLSPVVASATSARSSRWRRRRWSPSSRRWWRWSWSRPPARPAWRCLVVAELAMVALVAL